LIPIGSFLLFYTSTFAQSTFPNDFRKGGFEIGAQYPKVSLYSLDSTVFNTSDLENKITLINYWFVGCKGCLQEEAFLEEVSEYFSDDNRVQFISITTSPPLEVQAYLEKHGGFGFPIYTLAGFRAAKKEFKVRTFPHSQIVVDGMVVEKFTAPIATVEMKAWLIDRIKEALKGLD